MYICIEETMQTIEQPNYYICDEGHLFVAEELPDFCPICESPNMCEYEVPGVDN